MSRNGREWFGKQRKTRKNLVAEIRRIRGGTERATLDAAIAQTADQQEPLSRSEGASTPSRMPIERRLWAIIAWLSSAPSAVIPSPHAPR